MKRSIACLMAIILAFTLFGCSDAKKSEYPFEILEKTDPINAEIEMEDGSIIALELDPKTAPITVSNFVHLVKSGFYDGLIFHRVIKGFMIQGGDPQGTGSGGPGYNIKGEFSANGVKNNIKHEAGVISMARTQNMDGAGSQFFIMHEAAPHLDGQYAAFGKVTDGMDVVDKIANVKTDGNNKPLERVAIKTIRIIE